MIDAVYDRYRSPAPVVAYTFLGLSIGVTFACILYPTLYRILGGFVPHIYPWQAVTSIFVHGMPGISSIVHLAFAAFLVIEVGRPCERLLGRWRFLALTLVAVSANAVHQHLVGLVNGSSLVIWAWGPPLAVALIHARKREPGSRWTQGHQRVRGLLIVMYVGVTIAMAALPYAFGWRGNPLLALWHANRFHAVATGVGILLAALWWKTIRRRLEHLASALPAGTGTDGAGIAPQDLRSDIASSIAGELSLDAPAPDGGDSPVEGLEAEELEAGPDAVHGGGE